jgi:hypothetical protein
MQELSCHIKYTANCETLCTWMSDFISRCIPVITVLAANNTAGRETPKIYDHDTLSQIIFPSIETEKLTQSWGVRHYLSMRLEIYLNNTGGTRSWLRHCATSRKVAGSIPDGFIGIFYWHNPSGRAMALGLTQPLTEMSTRNISWGVKAAPA